MRILGIYKELRDVILIEEDDKSLTILTEYQDEGTEEEKNLIKIKLLQEGRNPAYKDTLLINDK